jgi:hypothetical protein
MSQASMFSAAALLGRSVLDPHGISIGLAADVLADRNMANVLGFEVETPRERAFLPFAACSISEGGDEITVASALSLLGVGELEYYVGHGISLTHLRATAAGSDLLVDERGRIAAVTLQPQHSLAVKVEVLDDGASGRTGASAKAGTVMALPLQQR